MFNWADVLTWALEAISSESRKLLNIFLFCRFELLFVCFELAARYAIVTMSDTGDVETFEFRFEL